MRIQTFEIVSTFTLENHNFCHNPFLKEAQVAFLWKSSHSLMAH